MSKKRIEAKEMAHAMVMMSKVCRYELHPGLHKRGSRAQLLQVLRSGDSSLALMVAETSGGLRVRKGEAHTEFVKRLVRALALSIDAIEVELEEVRTRS